MSAAASAGLFSRYGRRKLVNYVFVTLASMATAVAIAALVMILASLIMKGFGGINAEIFRADTPGGGGDLGTGGLRNAIVGSVMLCAMGMVIAVVIGILAGTWLAEYGDGNRLAGFVRFLNDVLLSAPSILIGLFGYELVVLPMHGGSALAGAIALAILTTPVVTRTTEDILRLQSNQLREAGMALGAGKGLVIRAIIWRASRTGLVTGGLLGFARMSGESAPLVFTNAGNQFFSWNVLGATASLPMTIFYFALSADENWQRLAWVAALLISVAVLSANIIGRALARGSQHK
ncbi:MAG TPA: phosphate ABC transporter permease PstA [Novosphingobium sp.]|nr:phosphate ABC transporter permease PstA [Novosphingobium sp.]HZV11487.1 phosphate ABC transporter permease PstA [Novosphingobium sp.]